MVILLGFLVFVNVSILGLHFFRSSSEAKKAQQYSFLSKRLFIENQNDIIVNLDPLRTQIRQYLSGTSTPHSFYLEYLPSGTSIRIGDDEELVGASLMKVPIIMDLYKAYELGKLDLDQKVTIDDQTISQKFGLLWSAGTGASLSLREAVQLALKESDNTAARLILQQTQKALDPKDRSLNFLDAEITESNLEQPVILISARSYSSFFRCLYLSCYLNYDHSQEVLNLLTKTDFHSRLEAGIPDKSVKIAHKIGTFSQQSSSDCGIVYAPKRPYLFCLMLRSTTLDVDKHMAEVSEMAYSYIIRANLPD